MTDYRIANGLDYNYFKKVPVSASVFGDPNASYGPDVGITFPTRSFMLINEGTGVVEYSFNGFTVHGELDSTKASAALNFDNRVISKMWFRVKAGSSGPINVSVHAW